MESKARCLGEAASGRATSVHGQRTTHPQSLKSKKADLRLPHYVSGWPPGTIAETKTNALAILICSLRPPEVCSHFDIGRSPRSSGPGRSAYEPASLRIQGVRYGSQERKIGGAILFEIRITLRSCINRQSALRGSSLQLLALPVLRRNHAHCRTDLSRTTPAPFSTTGRQVRSMNWLTKLALWASCGTHRESLRHPVRLPPLIQTRTAVNLLAAVLRIIRVAVSEVPTLRQPLNSVLWELARRAKHRLKGRLASCAFRNYQRDVVGLFMRAKSSSLICNCYQQLRQG